MSIAEEFNLAARGVGAFSILRDHLEAMDDLQQYAYELGQKNRLREAANDAAEGQTQTPPAVTQDAVEKVPEITPEEPPQDSDDLKYKGGGKAAGSLEGFLDELRKSGF